MKTLDQFGKVQCTCAQCVSYCKRAPGWFRPEQIASLAEFLKLSIQEVFKKYLIADFWIGDSQDIYVLAPVKDLDHPLSLGKYSYQELVDMQREHNRLMGRDCDRAGRRASWGYAFLRAPCIFLENDRCSIYPVRPFECAVSWHGGEVGSNIRKLIAEEWKGHKLIGKLLGG